MTTTKGRAAAAGARVPTDRAAKAEATGELVEVTVDGFTLKVAPDWLDDDDVMTDVENGKPHLALAKITSGPDQVAKIRESLRGEDGVVKRSALLQFVLDVAEAAGQGKSSPSQDS